MTSVKVVKEFICLLDLELVKWRMILRKVRYIIVKGHKVGIRYGGARGSLTGLGLGVVGLGVVSRGWD